MLNPLAGEPVKITGEVYQVGGTGLTSGEDASVYLVNFGGHAALVDAGCGHGEDKLLENIYSCGVSPEQIEYPLITHCHFDHTGGARSLKERIGLKIVAHELEACFLEAGDNKVTGAGWYGASIRPFIVDIKISDPREKIMLGGRPIEMIHMPGHSPGSVVYLIESEGLKIVFAQDVHGPIHPLLLSNREDYIKSLRYLLSLRCHILCEGHFGIYRGKREVARFIESFLS